MAKPIWSYDERTGELRLGAKLIASLFCREVAPGYKLTCVPAVVPYVSTPEEAHRFGKMIADTMNRQTRKGAK
jgi:hypothetical protein